MQRGESRSYMTLVALYVLNAIRGVLFASSLAFKVISKEEKFTFPPGHFHILRHVPISSDTIHAQHNIFPY